MADTVSPAARPLATGREKLLGHLAMLLVSAMIAGSFSFGDLAAPHLAPAALNAVRFALATLIMAFAVRIAIGKLPGFPSAPWRFVILGGLSASYFILMFVALRLSGPVSIGVIVALIPLMSAGFGKLFLGQTTRPIVWLSLLIAAAGAVWVIFRGDLATMLRFEIGTGEAIFLIGAAAYAAYAPLLKKFNRGEPDLVFTLMALAATTCWLVVVGAADIVTTDWTAVPLLVWAVIFYLVIFTTAATFFLLQYASLRLPASKVLSYSYLTPSFIILFEGALGHGWAPPAIFAGALVTAAALLVMAQAPDR